MAHSPSVKSGRRILKRVLVFGLFAVCVWLAASYAVAYRLTRRPQPLGQESAPNISWGTIATFRIATDDAEELGAWYIAGRSERPVVLLLHGNGGNRGTCLDQAELLASLGCSILMVSLRAHGDSSGDVNDFGYSARKDVVAAVEWLERNQPGLRIVIWGRSLGAAAAMFAAEDLGRRVRGYILECPYQELRTAVRNRTRRSLPPVLDRIAFTGLDLMSPLVLADADKISPLHAAGAIPKDTPVLVLAGGKDQHARPEEARAIAERIGPKAELVIVTEGEHLNLARADPDGFRARIEAFLR